MFVSAKAARQGIEDAAVAAAITLIAARNSRRSGRNGICSSTSLHDNENRFTILQHDSATPHRFTKRRNQKTGKKSRSRDSIQQNGGRRIVPEGLADVNIQINISWPENEASAELERVLAQSSLPVSSRASSFPGK
jgi:hypothetical protein